MGNAEQIFRLSEKPLYCWNSLIVSKQNENQGFNIDQGTYTQARVSGLIDQYGNFAKWDIFSDIAIGHTNCYTTRNPGTGPGSITMRMANSYGRKIVPFWKNWCYCRFTFYDIFSGYPT